MWALLVLARLTKAVAVAVPPELAAAALLVVQVERVRILARRCFSRPAALSRRWGLLSTKGVRIVASVCLLERLWWWWLQCVGGIGQWWIDVNVCLVFGSLLVPLISECV